MSNVATTFNTLTAPLIQQYTNYLPNAFDDTLSLLQKVNKVIQSISTTDDTVNNIIDQWNNTIVPYINGDGMQTDVNNKLDSMVSDGTLASLINQVFTTSLSSYIWVNSYIGIDLTGVTSSQTAITQAVNDAYTQGKTLIWEKGTYLSTDNIPYLHQVKHMGDGVISRNGNLFYVNPKNGQSNTIYVTPYSGVSGNDGLDQGHSPSSLQEALNILSNYANGVLGGTWNIQLYQGTYGHANFPSGILSENPINVNGYNVGAYPNQPQTIISDQTSGTGIYAEHGTRIQLNYLFAKGYTSGDGFGVSHNAELVTNNCWTDSCSYGIKAIDNAKITIPDGKHTNHGTGISAIQQSWYYLGNQYATDVTLGFVIDRCTYGFQSQEFSTGHVNWGTISNCGDGVYLYREASVNGDGIKFDTNTRDVRTATGGNFSATSNTQFSSNSGVTVSNLNGNNGGINAIDTFDENYFSSEKIYNVVNYNNYIKTTSATYAQTSTLKNPHWKTTLDYKVGKGIKFKIHGELDGTADQKRLQVHLSDGTNYMTVGTTFTATNSGLFTAEGTLYMLSATDFYMIMKTNINQVASFVSSNRNSALATASQVNLTKDLSLQVGGYVNNTADSLKIEVIEMSTFG